MDQRPDAKAAVSQAQDAVGQLLSTTRVSQGLVIADAARALRIGQKYLEALEDGRDQDLPGSTYAIGFVRSYAEYLNLDGEEIVRRYKDQAEDLQDKADLVFPKPIPDGGVPGAAVLGLGVVLAGVAYGVWYWNSNSDGGRVAYVDPVPEPLAVITEQTPAPMGNAQPEAPVERGVEKPVVKDVPQKPTIAVKKVVEPAPVPVKPAPVPVEPVKAIVSVPQDQTDVVTPEVPVAAKIPIVHKPAVAAGASASAAPTASVPKTPAAKVPGPHAKTSRITVRAKSNSWIQVRDSVADRLLFTRLLRKGDEYEVPNRDGLRLMTGNAGALELLVDGVTVPAIGIVGEVRRDIELDPEKLKSGVAVAH